MTTPSRHLTTEEACDLLRVDASTLRRYAREGKFSRIRLSPRKVLYIRDEIEAYIDARTIHAQPLAGKRRAGR
ncbi:DNA binding domain, excisionase family [Corynebacterium efficiens YS-314]|uniref:Helix-turn-helix domain-containing protein n=1 Tax=Corynebacterium efficiens (strain DSM 44549 / YS-314 / AJ 12310 / JCM 11189 / NBRC 100395) TaxID=196164 RepID=Q8FRD4_COREF|nr:helix-turn-helix domain-containing protein [Corynebacterium efficiens]EEW50450.1 DNA binding domain, excisionase family [Corynebacterium efficiens YS-314]BAC17637.1 hypothetical protein [Corynebacterium efficiens YS-314]